MSENVELIRSFLEKEIKTALFQMEKNKAAGPYGIPTEFFQVCWEIIKGDIMVLFDNFHLGTLDIQMLNYGIITLLPKVKEATRKQQFRPICLLNCLYKWFTKCLMIRLELVVGRLINIALTAFIQGRNIMYGILTLHEIIYETKRRGKVGVVLKLDFEKAYDKIHWGFLMDCLVSRGFDEKWCSCIRKVLTNGTVVVKINSTVESYFQSHKGVRQRDPLSPLFFNIAADCLTKIILTIQENDLITRLADNLIPNGVAILHYTDDTILCLEDNVEKARNVKLMLYMYVQMTSLKINFEKSEIVLISGDNNVALSYSQIFKCKIGLFPIKYLGVPISPSRLHVIDWARVEDTSAKKLDIW
jgi:hypothetical protein